MNDGDVGALAQEIHTDLDAIRRHYDRQFDPPAREAMADDAERWRRNVHRAIERAHHSVERLTSAQGNDTERSNAGRDAALAISALDAQLASIAAQVSLAQAGGQISSTVGSALTGLINNIQAVVRGISAQILQLIASLVTPVGWSIAGGLGTNLFGLQGNIQLELQFH
ncbi:MAG: hypothetical protein KatS3mg053_2809 [Candidatus Roseilinea sp.]|nr:MAG: hypothetical protein KatS3mg053_2809 [Candidatus Roseilinea sp.]